MIRRGLVFSFAISLSLCVIGGILLSSFINESSVPTVADDTTHINRNGDPEDPEEYTFSFTKLTSSLVDYRGTYFIGYDDLIFNASTYDIETDENVYPDMTFRGNSISSEDFVAEELDMQVIITRVTIDDTSRYFLQSYYSMDYIYVDSGLISKTVETDPEMHPHALPIDVIESNGDILIKCDDHTLCYKDDRFVFASSIDASTHPVSLYKLDIEGNSFVQGEIADFKLVFFDATDSCDPDGEDDNVTMNWEEVEEKFVWYTSEDTKGYFASLSYSHNLETPGSDADLVDRYDYIVSKYHVSDFMDRVGLTTYQNNYSPSLANNISFTSNEGVTPIIIIVFGTILISTLGAFVIVKRK